MTKGAGDPSDVMCKTRVKDWLKTSQAASWFIAGHTRFATRGKVNRRNSHPFRYGRIIGSHNGMCEAPQTFKVDSEHLFWALNKARGDYQKGLEDISGYWGLSWFDGEHFYLLSHSGELAYEIIDGVLYYSSSWVHLDSCTGGDGNVIKDGQVLRVSSDGIIANSSDDDSLIKPFVSKSSTAFYGTKYGQYMDWDNTNYGYSLRSGGSVQHIRNHGTGGRGAVGRKEGNTWQSEHEVDGYLDGTTTNVARDYDKEWQDAWASYCTESEHAGSDDEYADRYAG